MPKNVIIEDAVGVPDGHVTVFGTTRVYVPGSLEVFVNGLLVREQDEDGWVETGSKKFMMREPPLVGTTMRVFYKV